jgi:antitoxin component YwqK of YwqJK toxin-antitoxin module
MKSGSFVLLGLGVVLVAGATGTAWLVAGGAEEAPPEREERVESTQDAAPASEPIGRKRHRAANPEPAPEPVRRRSSRRKPAEEPAPEPPPVVPPPPAPPPEPPTRGPFERHRSDGTLLEKGTRFDGQLDGEWSSFHPGGSPNTSGRYRSGVKVGRWEIRGADGARSVTMYREGLKHGVEEAWHPDGKPRFRGEYSDGKLHGTWTSWHPNGRVLATREYWHGEQHGVSCLYYADGTLENEYPFVRGKLTGLARGYHANGKLEWQIEYAAGKRHGSAVWFDDNGEQTDTATYVRGRLATD